MSAVVLPISVVIASRNRPTLLADTIGSICDGREKPGEIVVIDQSDQPRSPAEVDNAGDVDIRHIASPSRGLSRARNAGAVAARFPLVAFTDDDMNADGRWLGALTRALTQAGPSAVVTGRVNAGASETSGGFVPSTVNRPNPATFSGRLPIDVLAGGNMAMHRAAFLRIGGFDCRLGAGTTFPAAEDNDLGYRLLEAGFTIAYVPDAVLTHRAWRSMDQYLALRFGYGRGKGAFYVKHAHPGDWHMVRRMTADLLRRAMRAPRRVLHPRVAAGEVVYAAGVLRGASEWLFHRHTLPERTEELSNDDELLESPAPVHR